MDTEFMYVPNVGLNSNTRRGSECMETEFMGHHSNQRRSSVQNVGLYSNTRRGSGCMETVLNVDNVGHHSNQRRCSGSMDKKFMSVQNVGLNSN